MYGRLTEKESWDEYSEFSDAVISAPGVQEMGKAVFRAIVPCPKGMVHDAACGIGWCSIPILEKTGAEKVICTDYSPRMLEKAREILAENKYFEQGQIELVEIDLLSEWPKEEFEAQVFNFFLYYFPPKERKEILKKAHDTTKLEGHIYGSMALKGYEKERKKPSYLIKEILKLLFSKINIFRSLSQISRLAKGAKTIKKLESSEYYPKREEFFQELTSSGFDNINIKESFMNHTFIVFSAQKLKEDK